MSGEPMLRNFEGTGFTNPFESLSSFAVQPDFESAGINPRFVGRVDAPPIDIGWCWED